MYASQGKVGVPRVTCGVFSFLFIYFFGIFWYFTLVAFVPDCF